MSEKKRCQWCASGKSHALTMNCDEPAALLERAERAEATRDFVIRQANERTKERDAARAELQAEKAVVESLKRVIKETHAEADALRADLARLREAFNDATAISDRFLKASSDFRTERNALIADLKAALAGSGQKHGKSALASSKTCGVKCPRCGASCVSENPEDAAQGLHGHDGEYHHIWRDDPTPALKKGAPLSYDRPRTHFDKVEAERRNGGGGK